MGAPCADYFNTTQYRPYTGSNYYQPYGGGSVGNQIALQDCEQQGGNIPLRNQRAVCMKKKQTTFGRTTYIRQCRFLHYDEKVGACPTETTGSSTTVDFCEYCDYDGCNGATTMRNSFLLAAVLPLVGMLLLRK